MSDLNYLLTAKLPVVVDRFLLDRQVANQAERTIETYTHRLKRFTDWCSERGVETITDINSEILAGYRRHLYHRRSDHTGKRLSASTQAQYLIIVRNLLRWLLKHKLIASDLAADIELPQQARRQLGDFLNLDEIDTILSLPDTDSLLGIRNRAILEVFYSTAIRVSELAALTLSDIDRERGLLVIRHGKGDKARLAPISKTALAWLDNYVNNVRPKLDKNRAGNALFLGIRGRALVRQSITAIVADLKESAGITKMGACHLLRHTAATQMAENGADILVLQSYLGHEHLSTTQIYTHMTLGRLKDIHNQTHPTGDKPSTEGGDLGSAPEPR